MPDAGAWFCFAAANLKLSPVVCSIVAVVDDPVDDRSGCRCGGSERSGWRNPKHAQDWPASLERFVFPRFGQRTVSEVTGADVVGALALIWHEKPKTAQRVRQRIGAVLQWAVAMEYRADNPCERVAATLGRQRDVVRHMRAASCGGRRSPRPWRSSGRRESNPNHLIC